jgi:8-amino-7-oxononanoate synthase
MRGLDAQLAADLDSMRAAQRYRTRRTVEARAPAMRVVIDGREVIAFCGNDYLGLAQHPEIVDAFATAARRWGVGSGASHLVCGHSTEHHELERELAAFVQRPRALLFSTGYMANLAIGATLAGRGDCVFEDRLNHASLIDAGLAGGARFQRYAHGDVTALRHRLRRATGPGRKLVVTDGVFSMDGDTAPLRDLAEACHEAGAVLVVDDAHGFGVAGPDGRGSVAAQGLGIEDVPVLMATLGKAAGTCGAFVAGSEALIESLIQHGRTYIYTTALPPALAAATRAALRVIRDEGWRRERVSACADRFRRRTGELGLRLLPSDSPIQPLVLGDEAAALAASEALLEAGIWVPAIRPPTVARGSSRLRITFSAAHELEDVETLVAALERVHAKGLLG